MNKICYLIFVGMAVSGMAQEEKKKDNEKALKNSMNLTWEANKELSENAFVEAEADYRRAISKSDQNVIAPYNLGTAYYKKESLEEAFGRFKQAGELASAKPEKHKAFHNMGNVFMKNEEYEKAVEAYKEALRNNPEDEETRYNLALAKALAKKQKDKDGGEKDSKEDEDSENKGRKEQEDQQQDNKEKEGGDQEKEDNKEGDGEEKKEQPKQGEKPEDQKQPKPNQLSPQQIKNLLEAMQNEENKVQEKMNEKKVKGPKSKNAKDW